MRLLGVVNRFEQTLGPIRPHASFPNHLSQVDLSLIDLVYPNQDLAQLIVRLNCGEGTFFFQHDDILKTTPGSSQGSLVIRAKEPEERLVGRGQRAQS